MLIAWPFHILACGGQSPSCSRKAPLHEPYKVRLALQVHDEALEPLLQLQKLVTLSISFSGMGPKAATSLLAGLPHVERLLLDGIPISMLGIRSLFRSRPGLLMWSPSEFHGSCALVPG